MAGIELDGANQKVVLDSDGDTYLEAATDDTVKVYVAGAQDFTITANTLTAESGSTIAAQALTATTITASGILKTDDATEATSTTDGSLQTDGGLSVVKDTVLGDDLKLLSDSSVVAFGADGDTTLTHTDGTGLTLNSTNKICFNDASQFVQGTSATVLSIGATDEIDLTATEIEINGALDLNGALNISGELNTFDDVTLRDDKKIIFGSGEDGAIGLAGEGVLSEDLFTFKRVASQAFSTTKEGIYMGRTSATGSADVYAIGGEAKPGAYHIIQDQRDDNSDSWIMRGGGTDNSASTAIDWISNDSGSADTEMRISDGGVFTTQGAHNASTGMDYAEYFEWKTALANDTKVEEAYGLSVVLDSGKIRLTETGEEAKVIGVIRPNNTSAAIGGAQELEWKDRWEKDVWGREIWEEYTLVDWVEKNEDGNIIKRHKYHKDRIPAKVLKKESELNKSEHDWYTLADNLTADNLVVPSTDEEKTAADYTERTTYKRTKGDNIKDSKLMRKKINSSYDKSKTYTSRTKRRKEWGIVGLIGQVEVRDSAIVPTSWTKMKNLETGIDLYYIK